MHADEIIMKNLAESSSLHFKQESTIVTRHWHYKHTLQPELHSINPFTPVNATDTYRFYAV